MSPPARASLLLRVEARLRAKLRRAERTVGRGLAVLPSFAVPEPDACIDSSQPAPPGAPATPLSAAELRGEIVRRLAEWRRPGSEALCEPADCVAIAAVEAEASGWIALLDDGRLVALNGSADGTARPSDAPDAIVQALAFANGSPRCESSQERDSALGALDAWLGLDWTHRSCGLGTDDSPLRRRVLRAIDLALHDAPRHRRTTILEWVGRVRRALTLPLPLGLERRLDSLVKESSTGRDWIEEAATLVARAPARSSESGSSGPAMVRALILFG